MFGSGKRIDRRRASLSERSAGPGQIVLRRTDRRGARALSALVERALRPRGLSTPRRATHRVEFEVAPFLPTPETCSWCSEDRWSSRSLSSRHHKSVGRIRPSPFCISPTRIAEYPIPHAVSPRDGSRSCAGTSRRRAPTYSDWVSWPTSSSPGVTPIRGRRRRRSSTRFSTGDRRVSRASARMCPRASPR